MKLLFIEPPYRSTIQQFLGVHGPILGFGSMANQLENEGHDVEILDCPTLGLELSDLKRSISESEPDVVGITSTTPSFGEACRVAETVKGVKPECTVIMGGPHVSFEDFSTVENSFVDVVVRGEGEITICELIATLGKEKSLSGVSGITYKEGGMPRRNPERPFIKDLDSLSVSYHKLPMDLYRFQGQKYATIVSSRGCPYGCVYCSSSSLHGKKWRCQSSDRVVEEIRLLVDDYGIRQIEFLDDLFTFDNKRVEEICNRLIEDKMDVGWFCSSRVDTITCSLMSKMQKAGCIGLYFGIESGSQRVLNTLGKGTRLDQAIKAIGGAREADIETVATFILGIPGETLDDVKQTIAFARKLRPDYSQFTYCTPYPGTQLHKFAEENDLLITRDWNHYTTMEQVMRVPGLDENKLRSLFRDAYLSSIPYYLLKVLRKRKFGLIKNIIVGTAQTMTS
jgi:anaerobic magnesium-protoporphyrin IX monomethyl ester cyclase